MGKATPKRRKSTINIRQKRRKKLQDLRNKYSVSKTAADKKKIIEKAIKISPHLNTKEYFSAKK